MSGSKFHVGTSGWTYEDWEGVFYPEGVRGPERLAFYVRQFDTVEINATFYRLPFEGVLKGWNRRLPEGYRVAVKGSQYITHYHRLVDPEEPLGRLFERISRIPTLKIVLWQLPPSMWKDEISVLAEFLAKLPGTVRHAVEFRHPSWWDGETVKLLSDHNAAFVSVSHPKLPDEVIPTADFLYLRFHGLGKTLYRYDYSEEELSAWAKRILEAASGREIYAYFNNDARARAPENAKALRRLLGDGSAGGTLPEGVG